MKSIASESQEFDSSRFYLGKFCPKEHEWKGSGKTLRYKSSFGCPVCAGRKLIGRGRGTWQEPHAIEPRFWAKVERNNPDECWLWLGSKTSKGYGSVSYDGKIARSHRVSYIMAFGEIADELHVLHRCDNPSCVNPSHLFLGTNADNVADRETKGRRKPPTGELNGRAVLSEDQVIELRKLSALGEHSQKQLAKKFNISTSTCGNILSGRRWKHLL